MAFVDYLRRREVSTMGFWSSWFGGGEGGSTFSQAERAYEKGDLNRALKLLMKEADENPKNVDGHLLTGRCFVKGGRYRSAFQVYSALVLHPEIRGHAEIPQQVMELHMVELLFAWAQQIEASGFPDEELQLFDKAADFYCGDTFCGEKVADGMGLNAGLQRRVDVTDTFAMLLRRPPGW